MAFACIVLAVAGLSNPLHAGAPIAARPSSDQARIERLVGLAKAWGAVRYFHPWLAYKPVDWDQALVDAIPKVDAARSREEYTAALNGMLAALDDPDARAEIARLDAPLRQDPSTATGGDPVRLDGVVLHVDAAFAAGYSAGDRGLEVQLGGKIRDLSAQATAVLLDLRRRSPPSPASSYFEHGFLQQALSALLDRDVPLPALRYRTHTGYAPQTGTASGGYYSALEIRAPDRLVGQRKAKPLPMVVVVNRNTASADVAMALRSAGLAHVLLEGARPGAGETRSIEPVPGIQLTIPVAEWLAADGSVGFTADETVPPGKVEAAARRAFASTFPRPARLGTAPHIAPTRELDRPYRDMAYPSREYRLLGLFRYWNAIEYFYPYKDLIGTDWNDVLTRYIPSLEAAADGLEYQRTIQLLATELHDSHGYVGGNTKQLQESIGLYVPALRIDYIEGQSVVTGVLSQNLSVHVGDVLLEVDGQPLERLREARAALVPASTPQDLQLRVHAQLLRGPKDAPVRLTLRDVDGARRQVTLPRSLEYFGATYAQARKRTRPVVDLLPGGMAYVDLDRLQPGEVDAMFERISTASAVIFDMRGYPNGTVWAIAPRLTTNRRAIAIQYATPIVSGLAMGYDGMRVVEGNVGDADGAPWQGKVAMLIDASTISQAEHTGLFLEAAAHVTFIGTATAGANGDITRAVVPGGITMNFSGASVRHGDGRQLQRVGLQPTIRVEPTIAGLAAGRDEVLEAAVKFLDTPSGP